MSRAWEKRIVAIENWSEQMYTYKAPLRNKTNIYKINIL